jgi:hypothetical protein
MRSSFSRIECPKMMKIRLQVVLGAPRWQSLSLGALSPGHQRTGAGLQDALTPSEREQAASSTVERGKGTAEASVIGRCLARSGDGSARARLDEPTLVRAQRADSYGEMVLALTGRNPDVPVVLGDNSTDLVFTPINPCRIMDTRFGTGPYAGLRVAGSTTSISTSIVSQIAAQVSDAGRHHLQHVCDPRLRRQLHLERCQHRAYAGPHLRCDSGRRVAHPRWLSSAGRGGQTARRNVTAGTDSNDSGWVNYVGGLGDWRLVPPPRPPFGSSAPAQPTSSAATCLPTENSSGTSPTAASRGRADDERDGVTCRRPTRPPARRARMLSFAAGGGSI